MSSIILRISLNSLQAVMSSSSMGASESFKLTAEPPCAMAHTHSSSFVAVLLTGTAGSKHQPPATCQGTGKVQEGAPNLAQVRSMSSTRSRTLELACHS